MTAVPLRYRRSQRALFVQKLQHAVPAIVVLTDGVDHLSHQPHGVDLALGVVEVGVALLVIGSMIYGLRELRKQTARAHADHAHAHGVDWIDICLSAMLAVEVYAEYHASGHLQRPKLLLSFVMLTVGVLHGRLASWGDRRRQLRVGPDGISLPWRKFMRLTLAWDQVASIEIDDRAAVITAIDGRHKRINLADVLQPKTVRDALMSARTFLDDARHAQNASIESNPSAV